MSNQYIKVKNTGVGAINIPFIGKHIRFDKNGNYPKNTVEYLLTHHDEKQINMLKEQEIIIRKLKMKNRKLSRKLKYLRDFKQSDSYNPNPTPDPNPNPFY